MTSDWVEAATDSIQSNAGRCDWCGKFINMNDGDELVISSEEDFESDEHDFSAEDVIEEIADSIELIGGPKDEMLADHLREEHGYRLHGTCFDKTALADLYEDTGSGGDLDGE